MFFTKVKEVTINESLNNLRNDLEELKKHNLDLSENIKTLMVYKEKVVDLENQMGDFLEIKNRRDGVEPFVEMVSHTFSEEHGLELKIDCNEAMINMLKRKGYVGVDENAIIQKYLSDLFASQINDSIPL